MSDFDGVLAAGQMVSNALFINRWFEDHDPMQNQGIAAQNGALQGQLQRLGADYNQLVDQYNRLANQSADTVREADATIAELRQRLAASELAREKAEAEAAFLRAFEELRSEPLKGG